VNYSRHREIDISLQVLWLAELFTSKAIRWRCTTTREYIYIDVYQIDRTKSTSEIFERKEFFASLAIYRHSEFSILSSLRTMLLFVSPPLEVISKLLK
jgi:hypothetical protein